MTREDVFQKFKDMGLIIADDVEYPCWITPNRSHIINIDHYTDSGIGNNTGGILIQEMDESEMGRWYDYELGIKMIQGIIKKAIDP